MTKRLQESDDNLSSQSITLEKQSQARFATMERIDSRIQWLCDMLEARYGNREVEITVFTGSDLRPWLDSLENHFKKEEFTDMQKMAMAHGFLGGEAESWYNKRVSWIPFLNWEDLKGDLLLHFGNHDDPERIELRLKIQKWFSEQTSIQQETSDSFVNMESNDSEVETEFDSVPVKDTCSNVVAEPMEAEDSILNADVVLHERSIPARDVMVDEESDAETEEIQHQISNQTEAPAHIQVPDLQLEPSLRFHIKSLGVCDAYYTGFGFDNFCERAESYQGLKEVFDASNVAENFKNSPSSTTLLCAYQLFEKMLLEVSKVKHKSMQRKIPKSWKFKYKFMKQRRFSVVSLLVTQFEIEVVNQIVQANIVEEDELSEEELDSFSDGSFIVLVVSLFPPKRRRQQYQETDSIGNIELLEASGNMEEKQKNLIQHHVSVIDVELDCSKNMLGTVRTNQVAENQTGLVQIMAAYIRMKKKLRHRFNSRHSKFKNRIRLGSRLGSKRTSHKFLIASKLGIEKQIVEWRFQIIQVTTFAISTSRCKNEFNGGHGFGKILQGHRAIHLHKLKLRKLWLHTHWSIRMIYFSVWPCWKKKNMQNTDFFRKARLDLQEVTASMSGIVQLATIIERLDSLQIQMQAYWLGVKQQKKQCQSLLFSAAVLRSITWNGCLFENAHMYHEEKFSAVWLFKFYQRPCVQEKLDNFTFSFLLFDAATVEARVCFSVWDCGQNDPLQQVDDGLCRELNWFWLRCFMLLPLHMQVNTELYIDKVVVLLLNNACFSIGVPFGGYCMDTINGKHLQMLLIESSLHKILNLETTATTIDEFLIQIHIYRLFVQRQLHKTAATRRKNTYHGFFTVNKRSDKAIFLFGISCSSTDFLIGQEAVTLDAGPFQQSMWCCKFCFLVESLSIQLEGKLGLRKGGIDMIRACSRLLQRRVLSWHLQERRREEDSESINRRVSSCIEVLCI